MAVEVNVLALCSGVGGLELGVDLATGGASRVICYVEREAYAAAVLVARMESGALDPAPVWSDLATFDAEPWRGVTDCVTSGFPCQPFSAAGNRRGLDDERWLWPAIAGIIRVVRPRFVFLENVPELIAAGLSAILGDLALLGFDAAWSVLRAADVGAPHLRRRVFVLAHAADEPNIERCPGRVLEPNGDRAQRVPPNTNSKRLQASERRSSPAVQQPAGWGAPGVRDRTEWVRRSPVAPVLGVDDGTPNRLDEARACGNGVVPQQAAAAWRGLWERLR